MKRCAMAAEVQAIYDAPLQLSTPFQAWLTFSS
jgi:hypothetical protein